MCISRGVVSPLCFGWRQLCWGQTVRSCSLTTTTALSKEWAFSVGSDTVPMQSWTTTETPEKGLEPQSDAGKPLFISRLLPWMCACAQSTLCDPMDCSPPGSSVHGILLARALEWGGHALLPGDLPNPGISPRSPALQVDS